MLRRSAIWDAGMQRKGAFGVGNMSLVWGHIVSTPMDSSLFFKPKYSISCNFISKDQNSSIRPQQCPCAQHGGTLAWINFGSAFSLPAEAFPPEAQVHTLYPTLLQRITTAPQQPGIFESSSRSLQVLQRIFLSL